jgi:DNA-binding protein H-NS
MAAIKYDSLSWKELNEMESKLRSAMARKKEDRKTELREKIEGMLESEGFTIGDIFPNARGKGRGGKVAIKYINPDNKSETWTGRGRQPRWLVAKLAKGGKLQDFTV